MCWICRLTAKDVSMAAKISYNRSRLTRQREQNNPVHNQHRPEYRQVEDCEEAAHESDRDRFGCRVPELKLW